MSRWSKLFLKFNPISMTLISSSCIFNKPKVSQKEQKKAKNDSKIITKQLNSINDEIDSLFHSINNRKNVETASINNKVNQQVNEFNSIKNGATLSQLSELEKVNNIYKTELNSKKQELLNQRNWINLLKDDRDSLNELKVRVNENKNKVNNYEFNAECTEQLARIDDLLESINSLIEQHEAIINETIALLDQIIDIFNRLEKDLENQKNEIQNPGHNPSNPPNPSPNIPPANSEKIRVGFWNVLNYGRNPKEYKTRGLACVINHMGYDVVGLVEIQSDQAVLELVKELNYLDKNAKWNVIQTDKPLMHNNLAANSAVKEYSSFLYKETLLKVIPIGGNNKWLAYDNSYWQDFGYTTGLKETGYMRPPVGVKFETTCGIKNDFTFVINHFDSPGGDTQEQAEAKNLYNTMKWFDEKDGNNDDLIFMGDTNIKLGNEKELFSFMFGNNYKSLIPESEANKTSLGLNLDRYSEPYDKAFIKTNLVYKNANIYKLYDFVKDGVYKYDSITTLDKWKKYIESQGKSYKKDYSYIRSAISDHCPISFDLYLDKNDPF